MKTNLFLIVTFLNITLFGVSCSHHTPRNISAFTPAQDQFWNEMSLESSESKNSILNLIEENSPSLYNQILQDSKDPYLPMFWGQSLNFDSGAKKRIVEDKIIADLQALFNIKNDNSIVHAGIMHTYGYLFSTINTPYGYKRKRWIAPTLNHAFSLNENSLSPDTIEGGLLSNLTYFSGSLAFKNKTDLNLLKNVSKEVFTYDYSKLKFERLEETTHDYTLVTTLVHFPKKLAGDDNEYLLIYSSIQNFSNKESLITAFPINADSFNKIVNKADLGANQKITLRYNGYLENFDKILTGTRKLIKN